MALLSALCSRMHLPNGFSNSMLRGQVAALQGLDLATYSVGMMTYDLRRLRLKGLIKRIPHRHRYVVTVPGRRTALFFSKAYAQIIRRGLSRLDVPRPDDAPCQLRKAWHQLDTALDRLVADAQMAPTGTLNS